MHIDVYDRQDNFISAIERDQILSLVWTDELNGEDSLAIATTHPLSGGDRLVWTDANGKAHEHICQQPIGASGDGKPVYTDTALNSICELFGDYIEDKRPYGYSFERALSVALEPTRWEVGTVDETGAVAPTLTFYHVSAREAVQSIIECGGDLETELRFDSRGMIASRRVGIRAHRGRAGCHKRFAYGKDVISVSKTVHWEAMTACYGYGKGVETESGGYGRKLTFGSINNGKDYIENDAALKKYGRPDGKGGLAHVFGKYENPDCTDETLLMLETRDYLLSHIEPGVTYEASVVDLSSMGREWEGVGVGDDVQIVDTSFSPTLRCEGRVTKLVTDLLSGRQTVTLGNVTDTMADIWQQQQHQIGSLQNSSANWDAAGSATPSFLQTLMSNMNEQFNRNGMSYTHTSFENGTIWSSVPLDEDGRPTKGGSAIQICSQGLRIASSTNPDGSFDWRTFGTGDGFVADCIIAGVIEDAGRRNRWNLDTGQLTTNGIVAVNADVTGKINATTGRIGGFDISKTSISNGAMALKSNGLWLERNGKDIGLIGSNGLVGDDSKSGLNFDLEDSGDYMTWAAKESSSADSYTMFLTYAKSDLPTQPGGKWMGKTLHVSTETDFHKYILKNAYIDPDSGGAKGGVNATINFVQVLGVNNDGTISRYGNDARMVFKNGLLTDVYYYKK